MTFLTLFWGEFIGTALYLLNGFFSRTTWVSRHQKGKSLILMKHEMMGWQ